MIKLLEWDSNFFGFNIGQLCLEEFHKNPQALSHHLSAKNISLAQSNVDLKNSETIKKLEAFGFHFVDLNITFSRTIGIIRRPKLRLEQATERDLDALVSIAQNLYSKTRFNYPPFSPEIVQRFYNTWIKNAITGTYDNVCLISGRGDQNSGFITLKLLSAGKARIGLIGVHPHHQNKRTGSNLLQGALNYLQERRIKHLNVSTQGKNIKAQNFFISNQFRVSRISSWYYRISTESY